MMLFYLVFSSQMSLLTRGTALVWVLLDMDIYCSSRPLYFALFHVRQIYLKWVTFMPYVYPSLLDTLLVNVTFYIAMYCHVYCHVLPSLNRV
jgi:hypothetical protein